jgi:uncharacterized protein YcbX
MAGRLRYWKEKDGRFWARIAVPVSLRPFLDQPRSELIESLGGDRRLALRLHPAAVARLQREIATAQQKANAEKPAPHKSTSTRTPITTADFSRAVWQRYTAALEGDDAARDRYASAAEIAAELAKLEQKANAGEITGDPLAVLDASLDFLRIRENTK